MKYHCEHAAAFYIKNDWFFQRATNETLQLTPGGDDRQVAGYYCINGQSTKMDKASQEFIKLMKHPLKFRMFLLAKLPSAFLAGVRIKDMDERKCEVTVPFKWLTQNPFRSTYFACLAMAAEMSTGALAMAHLFKRQPKVSMLVVKVESDYHKKAVGRTTFVCEDGDLLNAAIEKAIDTGEGQSFRATSTGKNEQGELVAVFFVTWSFKAKKGQESG